jgi:hypothetical protein
VRNQTIERWGQRWESLTSSSSFADRLFGHAVVLPVLLVLLLVFYVWLHRRAHVLFCWTRRATCWSKRVAAATETAPEQQRSVAAVAAAGTVAADPAAESTRPAAQAMVQPQCRPRYLESIELMRKSGLDTYDLRHHPTYAAAFVGSTATLAPRNELSYCDSLLEEARATAKQQTTPGLANSQEKKAGSRETKAKAQP